MRPCLDCQNPVELKHARYCDGCRWAHRRKPAKYVWTAEKDAYLREKYVATKRGRKRAISKALGWPEYAIQRRASELGLSKPWPKDRRAWTREEIAFLHEHAGARHVNWIRLKLKRGLSAVIVKMKRLGLSRRLTEGYTMRGLEEAFGADHREISRWIARGWLKASRLPEEGEPDITRRTMHVTHGAVRRFVREHWDEIDIRKVDQTWLGDVIWDRGALAKEQAA